MSQSSPTPQVPLKLHKENTTCIGNAVVSQRVSVSFCIWFQTSPECEPQKFSMYTENAYIWSIDAPFWPSVWHAVDISCFSINKSHETSQILTFLTVSPPNSWTKEKRWIKVKLLVFSGAGWMPKSIVVSITTCYYTTEAVCLGHMMTNLINRQWQA